jgi:type IV pilus assembly protein PilM
MDLNFNLDKILSIFSGKKQADSVVGIDVGSSSIKVVEIRKKNDRAVLHTYGEISLGPYAGIEVGRSTKLEPAKISEALVDVLTEAKTSTPKCAISIPLRSSMVSIFEMPKLDNKKLANMIPIEARKYIPVPISEVSLDWFVIPDDPAEEVPVEEKKFVETMVVAIHNDVLSDYSSIVSNSGLQASFFEIEMFSTIRAVVDPTDNAPVMIVDIGSSATKVYISERGVIRDSHTINQGSQKVTLNVAQALGVDVEFAEKLKRSYGNNEPAQDKALAGSIDWIFDPLFVDVKQMLLNFQKKSGKAVSKVVLVGGGSLLNGLEEKAQKKLEVEVSHADPFEKIEAPAFLEDVLKETGASFAVAIGLALRQLQELE